MKKLVVHFIATKRKAIAALQAHFAGENIELIPYHIEILPEVDYLLLLEPIEIATQQYAISSVWKRWLLNHAAGTRLIVAGFAESNHPNFLNPLDIPNQFTDWLKQLPSVGAYQLQYAGVDHNQIDIYSDPWNRFLPVRGIDMIKEMSKFLDGHDPHYSFNNQLFRIYKEFMDLIDNAPPDGKFEIEDIKHEFGRAKHEWELLHQRWQYYGHLFSYLPFQPFAERTIRLLGVQSPLSQLFQNTKTYISKKEIESICWIIKALLTAMKDEIQKHVYQEKYW